MYYRPTKGVAADVIPFFYNGEYYLFYLKDYRDRELHGEGVPWNLLKTSDLVQFHELGEVLSRGSAEEQDLFVFTGSVFQSKDKFYIFYTGHNYHLAESQRPMQAILLAESDDLVHWTKRPDFRLEAPSVYEKHDFRDPFVFYDESEHQYKMLLAGRLKTGLYRERGCTIMATSHDLFHWDVNPIPFYAPHRFYTHECPDLFRIGDWYYLIFSEFNDKCSTRYRMSKSINGPWIAPEVDTFDNRSYYAAKTASDGSKRYLFGWNPIKNHEKDAERWQWGGTIVPHEIVQSEDGQLFVKCPDAIKEAYSIPVPILDVEPKGTVSIAPNLWRIGDRFGSSSVRIGKIPECCRIDIEWSFYGPAKDFGVFLNQSEDGMDGYFIKFEPSFNRLCIDRPKRNWDDHHFMVESERFCPLTASPSRHTMVLILEGSVLECYVDDRIAMSSRMFDFHGLDFGLYANESEIIVHRCAIYRDR